MDLISKDDSINMLKCVLNENEKNQLNEKVLNSFSNMKETYNLTKKRERKKFITLFKRAKISLKNSRKYGFKVSSNLWNSCGKKIYKIAGRKKLSKEIIKEINDHCENLSEIASNRTIKIDGEDINIRYLKMSIREVYQKFSRKNEVKLSTFYSYVAKKN